MVAIQQRLRSRSFVWCFCFCLYVHIFLHVLISSPQFDGFSVSGHCCHEWVHCFYQVEIHYVTYCTVFLLYYYSKYWQTQYQWSICSGSNEPLYKDLFICFQVILAGPSDHIKHGKQSYPCTCSASPHCPVQEPLRHFTGRSQWGELQLLFLNAGSICWL